MPNIFKNREQRDAWNKYNAKYAKENYKTVSVKLNKEKDRELIEWLENLRGVSVTEVFKIAMTGIIEKEEKPWVKLNGLMKERQIAHCEKLLPQIEDVLTRFSNIDTVPLDFLIHITKDAYNSGLVLTNYRNIVTEMGLPLGDNSKVVTPEFLSKCRFYQLAALAALIYRMDHFDGTSLSKAIKNGYLQMIYKEMVKRKHSTFNI